MKPSGLSQKYCSGDAGRRGGRFFLQYTGGGGGFHVVGIGYGGDYMEDLSPTKPGSLGPPCLPPEKKREEALKRSIEP